MNLEAYVADLTNMGFICIAMRLNCELPTRFVAVHKAIMLRSQPASSQLSIRTSLCLPLDEGRTYILVGTRTYEHGHTARYASPFRRRHAQPHKLTKRQKRLLLKLARIGHTGVTRGIIRLETNAGDDDDPNDQWSVRGARTAHCPPSHQPLIQHVIHSQISANTNGPPARISRRVPLRRKSQSHLANASRPPCKEAAS